MLISLTAAPSDPVMLAAGGRWDELKKAIDTKKITRDPALLTTTRVLACKAQQDEIATKLAALGASGGLYCLAIKQQWEQLGKDLTAAGTMTHERADSERLSMIVPLLASAKQDALLTDLATRASLEQCPYAFSVALAEGNVALGKKLSAACPPTPAAITSGLRSACDTQSVEAVRAWKGFGANLTQPLDRTTCLHRAALRGALAITTLLLEEGADVNAIAQEAPTYRFPPAPAELNSVAGHAVLGGNPEVVKALLAKGADFSKLTSLVDRAALFPGENFGNITIAMTPDPQIAKESPAARLVKIASLLHSDQRAVLVIGGGTTPEAAQKSLETWKQVGPLVQKFFKVPAGFPTIAASDSIPGLKPGFHVVLLAAGPEWLLNGYLPIVNALRPGSAVRQVTWTPPAGPAPLVIASDFDRQTTVSRKVKKSTLSLAALWRANSATLVATLFDANGEFVTSAQNEANFGVCSSRCDPVEFVVEGSGFAASADGEFPGCTAPDVRSTTVRVLVKGEALEIKESSTLISKGACD